MYNKTLYNRLGDRFHVDARKERNKIWLMISSTDEEEHDAISLNYDEYIKLRQMLTEAFAEMGW
jgi:hypothetical protein